ncbi:hypothetical protein DPMN_094102 [Dreissena polymorpha]|uniref:Uncharacterized protein n=1 Tax=Dreissena polymorpha TaxID=45954 RepID=A0A9D4L551_DREPO|nr:hypothetical protein DPMN_094102 [Dreissena polymorpha]
MANVKVFGQTHRLMDSSTTICHPTGDIQNMPALGIRHGTEARANLLPLHHAGFNA